jgi:PA14 domain
MRQTDAAVDFAWGTGGPAALGTVTDNFSVRWTGNLSIDTAGDYTFSTRSDEGNPAHRRRDRRHR